MNVDDFGLAKAHEIDEATRREIIDVLKIVYGGGCINQNLFVLPSLSSSETV